jgi:hypothetical protein
MFAGNVIFKANEAERSHFLLLKYFGNINAGSREWINKGLPTNQSISDFSFVSSGFFKTSLETFPAKLVGIKIDKS